MYFFWKKRNRESSCSVGVVRKKQPGSNWLEAKETKMHSDISQLGQYSNFLSTRDFCGKAPPAVHFITLPPSPPCRIRSSPMFCLSSRWTAMTGSTGSVRFAVHPVGVGEDNHEPRRPSSRARRLDVVFSCDFFLHFLGYKIRKRILLQAGTSCNFWILFACDSCNRWDLILPFYSWFFKKTILTILVMSTPFFNSIPVVSILEMSRIQIRPRKKNEPRMWTRLPNLWWNVPKN